jgi:hypothetical protein
MRPIIDNNVTACFLYQIVDVIKQSINLLLNSLQMKHCFYTLWLCKDLRTDTSSRTFSRSATGIKRRAV